MTSCSLQVPPRRAIAEDIGQSAIATLFAFLAYYLLCLFVQIETGAFHAPFTSYPDEPSHFVGSVMVHDYLTSGDISHPAQFARNFYEHYPYFAVGYWPPLFYVITGLFYCLVGIGRGPALLVVGATSAGMACLIFVLMKRRVGAVVAFCAGLVFLALPEVQRWTCSVMLDTTVAFFCLGATLFVIRGIERNNYRDSLGFVTCAVCAGLTKYNGLFVAFLYIASILILRRFALLRSPWIWSQPLLIGALVAPWMYFSRQYLSIGLLGFQSSLFDRIVSTAVEPVLLFPNVLEFIIVGGLLGFLIRPKAWTSDLTVITLLYVGLVGSLMMAPVGVEGRYVIAGSAALLILSLSGWYALTERYFGDTSGRAAMLFAVGLAVLVMSTELLAYAKAPSYSVEPVVDWILANIGSAPTRILAPPDLEGPTIAEFAMRAPARMNLEIQRPSKLFSTSDWIGRDYMSRFSSEETMMSYLSEHPVELLIWHGLRPDNPSQHEYVMQRMLTKNQRWRMLTVLHSTAQDARPWMVYAFVP